MLLFFFYFSRALSLGVFLFEIALKPMSTYEHLYIYISFSLHKIVYSKIGLFGWMEKMNVNNNKMWILDERALNFARDQQPNEKKGNKLTEAYGNRSFTLNIYLGDLVENERWQQTKQQRKKIYDTITKI